MLYKDRKDAGRQLAEKLKKYINENPIIIALPRGGVVVGYEVSKILHAPLDVVVPRKIGSPFNPEFGIGAIAPNGVCILDDESVKFTGISELQLFEVIEKETVEMNRRTNLYRKDCAPLDFTDKTIIVVDDGIATGVSTKAAVLSIKKMNPRKIVLAVPVCPLNTEEKFKKDVDEFMCLNESPDFYAVGAFYLDFDQISDFEVIDLLQRIRFEKY